MEEQLKFSALLPLKEMALRRVAVLLCSDPDVLTFFFKSLTARLPTFKNKEWQEVIEEKVLKLQLPESLKQKMIDTVQPIGFEIRRWKKFHQAFFDASHEKIDLPVPSKISWTTAGAIDYRKTAEEHLSCNVLNVLQRYKIACFYCLENYIPRLWEDLSKDQKKLFSRENLTRAPLEFCWPRILEEQSNPDYCFLTSNRDGSGVSFNVWAFENSAKEGNKAAAQFFFQQLTHVEREASLMRTAYYVLGSPNVVCFELGERLYNVLCYLLSLMTAEQQMEIVKARPVDVLLCFVDWPRQDLFSKNAGFIWTHVPPRKFDDLVNQMTDMHYSADYYFPKLLQEFLKHSSLEFRKYFVDEKTPFGTAACRSLAIFAQLLDLESVEIIFRNTDAADRMKLIFDYGILHRLYHSVFEGRWDVVEVFLREAALSKEDKEKLKESFLEFLKSEGGKQYNRRNRNVKKFFEILEVTDPFVESEKLSQKLKLEKCCAQ